MKKTVIFLSLFIYLCASTCAGELFKIPVLLSHFIEHKTANTGISFYTFLYQHYQDDDGNDQDNDRDEQLPFKSQDNSTSATTSPSIPHAIAKIRFTPVTETAYLHVINYKDLYIPSPYLTRIWQPPKFS